MNFIRMNTGTIGACQKIKLQKELNFLQNFGIVLHVCMLTTPPETQAAGYNITPGLVPCCVTKALNYMLVYETNWP